MSALYLYPGWLRLWHWLNALLFLVLILTGASMHFAGKSWLVQFDTAVLIHNTAGILLTIAWLGLILGNMVTTNGRHYRIRLRGLFPRLWSQIQYYSYGIFHNAPHPFHITEEMKLNPLQQLSYVAVIYLLMPFLVISGWAFLYSVFLPERLFGVGSVWFIAMLHLTISYFLVLFLVVHVYIMTAGDTVTTSLRGMLTGWHRSAEQE